MLPPLILPIAMKSRFHSPRGSSWTIIVSSGGWWRVLNALLASLSLSRNQFLAHDHGHGDATYSAIWKCCITKKQPTYFDGVSRDKKIIS